MKNTEGKGDKEIALSVPPSLSVHPLSPCESVVGIS